MNIRAPFYSGVTLCVLALALFACAPSYARDRAVSLAQFDHTRWTMQEGAPDSIVAIAQTADGYLWLGTDTGLVRFDGVRFERMSVAPPLISAPPSISSLYAPAGGGLWIGYKYGGLSFLKDGRVTQYTAAQDRPFGAVASILEDRDGVMWAVSANGLSRLEGDRWHGVGADWGYPSNLARGAMLAADGDLWVATESELVFLPKGARKFQRSGIRVDDVTDLIQTAGEKLWFAQSRGPLQSLQLKPVLQLDRKLPVAAQRMLFDSDSSLWLTTADDGVRRVRDLQPVAAGSAEQGMEAFSHKDGLSSDHAQPILRDREGVIWVGTAGGLDRFRRNVLAPAEFPAGSRGIALAAGDDGTIWAGARNRALMRLQDEKVSYIDAVQPPVTTAYRDADGVLWFGGAGVIRRVSGGDVQSIALPSMVEDNSYVQSITKDQLGALWAVVTGSADVLKYSGGTWSRLHPPELPTDARAFVMMTDRTGAVWVGYSESRVVRITAAKADALSSEAGLAVGDVLALYHGAKHHWIGGVLGLASFDGERFRRLGAVDEALNVVTGIHESAGGGLWLAVQRGIAHISGQEVERALADPNHRLRYRLFDALDGLPGVPNQLRPLPTLVAGSNGRLWFSTSNGVVSLDPRNISINTQPPPVVIESISADGIGYDISKDLLLPRNTANLEINYTALSMSMPERVRFRYRLEGAQADWQDVGLRRQAFYMNLGPGAYRFHVIASNEDGFWNAQGAALDFVIQPTFVQTRWFIVLCVAALAAVLWLLHRLRLRQVTVRLQRPT